MVEYEDDDMAFRVMSSNGSVMASPGCIDREHPHILLFHPDMLVQVIPGTTSRSTEYLQTHSCTPGGIREHHEAQSQ